MYRLLATDIDDTLLAPDGSLPAANHDALVRLHEAGITIVFCSGRSDTSIRKVAAPILEPADDEYYIGFNGARTVTAKSRTIVSRRYLTGPSVSRVVAYARKHALHVQGYAGDAFVVEVDDEYTRKYAEATATAASIVSDLSSALAEGSPKLLIVGTHEELLAHRDALRSMSNASPRGERFSVMFSKPKYLEIVSEGVHKGDALVRLAETLGIPIEATLAVGDADNDAEMLRAAGTGVAVANAHPGAKAAADVVLEASAADGAMAVVAKRYFGV
ncbi:MAG: Cof-type HAD-IIB family hydrolase [Spirochaetota bacterium]